MMISNLNPEGSVVQAEVSFRAPKDKVYKAWTDASILEKWFFVEEGYTPHDVEVNLRELGAYRIPIRHPNAETETVIVGHFIGIREGRELEYTWTGACSGEQYWTLVTASFLVEGTGSRVRLSHGIFRTDQDRIQHEMGWLGCLGQLAKLLGEPNETA